MNRASDIAAEQLRIMIVKAEIEPDRFLTERWLAGRLECGRMPLREAVQRLDNEGILRVVPRRGILVPELSITQFQDVAEAALLMGNHCVALAGRGINPKQIQGLDEIVAQAELAEQANDFYEVAKRDREFHVLIAEFSGNLLLASFTRWLYAIAMRFSYFTYVHVGSACDSLDEHKRLVRALEGADIDAAVREHHEHLRSAKERIAATL